MVRREPATVAEVGESRRRAGRNESQKEEEEEEVIYEDHKPEVSALQDPQPKEEPQDLGESEQSTRSLHPLLNRNNNA